MLWLNGFAFVLYLQWPTHKKNRVERTIVILACMPPVSHVECILKGPIQPHITLGFHHKLLCSNEIFGQIQWRFFTALSVDSWCVWEAFLEYPIGKRVPHDFSGFGRKTSFCTYGNLLSSIHACRQREWLLFLFLGHCLHCQN